MLSNISSSAAPFSFCLRPFPVSGYFTLNQLFTSGRPSIGVSVSAISPSNEYARLIPFRIDWFDLLEVQHKTVFFLLWSFLQTVPVSSVCYSAPQGITKSLGQCRPSQASWTWSCLWSQDAQSSTLLSGLFPLKDWCSGWGQSRSNLPFPGPPSQAVSEWPPNGCNL